MVVNFLFAAFVSCVVSWLAPGLHSLVAIEFVKSANWHYVRERYN